MKRNLIRLGFILLALALLAVLFGFIFVHNCDSTGVMGQSVVACDCTGYEWLLYDRTEADGPKRSLCLGLVHERQCFEFTGGRQLDCRELRTR